MTDDFASAAARLAGVAGARLGWTPDQFWAATPAELAAIAAALIGPALSGAFPPDADTIAKLKEAFPDE